MALSGVLKNVDFGRRRKRRAVEVSMSGNYATGGDTLDLTAITNPNFVMGAQFSKVPSVSDVTIKNSPDGYTAEFIPGSALNNCKVKFRSTADTELAAGAYGANMLAAKLELEFSSKMFKEM